MRGKRGGAGEEIFLSLSFCIISFGTACRERRTGRALGGPENCVTLKKRLNLDFKKKERDVFFLLIIFFPTRFFEGAKDFDASERARRRSARADRHSDYLRVRRAPPPGASRAGRGGKGTSIKKRGGRKDAKFGDRSNRVPQNGRRRRRPRSLSLTLTTAPASLPNQPTNQKNQPTNQKKQPTKKTNQPTNQAYGPGGLGVIAVSGVPGLGPARARLLPLAQRLASLPPRRRRELEDPASRFNFGWSHGKESLSDGRADVRKGSFYANPLLPEGKESPLDGTGTGADGGGEEEEGGDTAAASAAAAAAAALARFPGVCRPNVWPRDPSVLPELRPAFRETGRILADVAIAVAGACDAMLAAKQRRESEGGEGGGKGGGNGDGNSSAKEASSAETTTTTTTLRSLIESGDAAKGRLLYYYPPGQRNDSLSGGIDEEEEEGAEGGGGAAAAVEREEQGEEEGDEGEEDEEEEEEDRWGGWHVDSGALTALVRAMFLDERGAEVEDPGPGSGAGLYVRPRRGWRHRRSSGGELEPPEASNDEEQRQALPAAVRVSIPDGCVAVQAGEAAQVFSGGAIVATPHCVRGVGCGGAKKSKKSKGSSAGNSGVSRATFALFMQPRWDAPLEPCHQTAAAGGGSLLPPFAHSPESVGVARWRPGDTFGDFTERTFDAYYK